MAPSVSDRLTMSIRSCLSPSASFLDSLLRPSYFCGYFHLAIEIWMSISTSTSCPNSSSYLSLFCRFLDRRLFFGSASWLVLLVIVCVFCAFALVSLCRGVSSLSLLPTLLSSHIGRDESVTGWSHVDEIMSNMLFTSTLGVEWD